jgi:glycosyltransferase involved in cell wall biosynthesis
MKNKAIFVIPFILPWDRPADYQRQTCLTLAKNHKVIVYMQGDAVFFLKAILPSKIHTYPKQNNIQFYRPVYVLPLRRFDCVNKVNQLISYVLFQLFVLGRARIILWVFDPTFYLFPKFTMGISLYDCVDFHAGFHTSMARRETQKQEQALIGSVQYFFVNSQILRRVHKTQRQGILVPAGFRLNDFVGAPKEKVHVFRDKPVVGYIGSIDERVDFRLLEALVGRNPQWTFVLWGPVLMEDPINYSAVRNSLTSIMKYPNVMYGSSGSLDVPFVINQFSVGIIPYDYRHQGVKYSYPMKVFEYFYAGKPVVSTPIIELSRFTKYIRMGSTIDQWEHYLRDLLFNPWKSSYKREQKNLAIENSWERKIDIMLQILGTPRNL